LFFDLTKKSTSAFPFFSVYMLGGPPPRYALFIFEHRRNPRSSPPFVASPLIHRGGYKESLTPPLLLRMLFSPGTLHKAPSLSPPFFLGRKLVIAFCLRGRMPYRKTFLPLQNKSKHRGFLRLKGFSCILLGRWVFFFKDHPNFFPPRFSERSRYFALRPRFVEIRSLSASFFPYRQKATCLPLFRLLSGVLSRGEEGAASFHFLVAGVSL